MVMKQVIEMYELLDSAKVDGNTVASFLRQRGLEQIEVKTIKGDKGSTDFIKADVPGSNGKSTGGKPIVGVNGHNPLLGHSCLSCLPNYTFR